MYMDAASKDIINYFNLNLKKPLLPLLNANRKQRWNPYLFHQHIYLNDAINRVVTKFDIKITLQQITDIFKQKIHQKGLKIHFQYNGFD